jgi:hypothetical protein
MCLVPFISIQIQQIPSGLWDGTKDGYPARNRLIELDFVNEYEIESGWENHTDKCTLRFPKNIVLNVNNKNKQQDFLVKESGTYNVILGGSGAIENGKNVDKNGNPITYPPLIMKGDIVYVQDGYLYRDENLVSKQVGATQFVGYVSMVHSKIPIEVEVEDNFYLLKRTPVNKTEHNGKLLDLCKEMVGWANDLFANNSALNINGVNPYPKLELFDNPDSITAEFSLGHLDIGSGLTCALLLDRLRSQYKFESLFLDNKLRFGFPIYDESLSKNTDVFEFQNNITEDNNLEYKNKDDIVLSAVVFCKVIKETDKKTFDGESETKKERLSILIYWDIPTGTFKYIKKQKGEPFTKNEGGERHMFPYPIDLTKPAPSIDDLFEFGKKQLEKYHYTGFKGSFTTFGFPFVKWGDNIMMLDNIIADRNGIYKVKKVVRKGGDRIGITQEIFLDYKLNIALPTAFSEIYMI